MIELQGCSLVQAFHEGRDQAPRGRRQSVNMGARQSLRCRLRLQSVDRAMGIHHDEMKAVAGAAGTGCHAINMLARYDAVLGLGRGKALQAIREGAALVVGQAREHLLDTRFNAAQNLWSVWNSVPAVTILPGTRHDVVQKVILHLAGETFTFEVGGRNAGTVGVRSRRLQQGEVVLDLVVSGERAPNAAGQQQLCLAKLSNDLLLRRHGTISVVI